jgi:manganese/iron transport system permease protein
VVFTAFFAFGLLLISLRPAHLDLKAIIYGNILAIAPGDVWQIVIVAALAVSALAMKWRDLLLVSFDPAQAQALGLPVRRLQLTLLLLLSATTVAALQAVGAILVVAMLITPGATAYLLTDRFGKLLALGAALGAATAFLGAYASYFLDGATGGCIVLLQALVFLAVLTLAPRHGLLAARRARLLVLRP